MSKNFYNKYVTKLFDFLRLTPTAPLARQKCWTSLKLTHMHFFTRPCHPELTAGHPELDSGSSDLNYILVWIPDRVRNDKMCMWVRTTLTAYVHRTTIVPHHF